MKNLIIAIIILIPLKFYAQCYTFTIQITSESCVGCCDGTASVVGLSGGCPPYTFLWSDPAAQTTQTATGLCSGTLSVDIHDSGSCCPDTIAYCCLDCPTGINNSSSPSSIKAFIIDNSLEVKNVDPHKPIHRTIQNCLIF
jgi:hypothetical protein